MEINGKQGNEKRWMEQLAFWLLSCHSFSLAIFSSNQIVHCSSRRQCSLKVASSMRYTNEKEGRISDGRCVASWNSLHYSWSVWHFFPILIHKHLDLGTRLVTRIEWHCAGVCESCHRHAIWNDRSKKKKSPEWTCSTCLSSSISSAYRYRETLKSQVHVIFINIFAVVVSLSWYASLWLSVYVGDVPISPRSLDEAVRNA